MNVQSHKYMCNVINKNIFFSLKKKLSLFKVIKLNKLFLNFSPELYLNQINIFFNQINDVNKIITFIRKRLKRWFLEIKWIYICSKGVFTSNWINELKETIS